MLKNASKIKNKISVPILMNIFSLFYILFAFNRIKFSLSSQIDGVALNNGVWLFPILLFLKIILSRFNKAPSRKINIQDIILLVLILVLIIIILIGGFKTYDIKQYLYATLQLVVPLMFIFSFNINDVSRYFDFFTKLLVSFCLIYSLLAIVSSLNFGFFMELMGNQSDYRYYSQVRAPLMLGSSITVSYYLNLTLPICFFLNYTVKEKNWKILSLISILLNLAATAILLSRLAFFISVFIVIVYVLFVRSNQFSKLKKILLTTLIILGSISVQNDLDLSRLFNGFKDSSTSTRFSAMNLGVYLFKQNPIFGTGLGRYFTRAYSDSEIIVDGIRGLVDPHNLYIMIISEIGLAGFIVLVLIFIKVVSNFRYIENNILRKTAYIVLCAFLLGAFGGSQLLNEISFSTLFWMYMSFFRAIGVRDYLLKGLNEITI